MVQDTPIRQKAGSKNIAVPVIAGAAGLALLAGGTTFALWTSEATIPGVEIQTGTFLVQTVGELTWQETFVGEGPDTIDLEEFEAGPGTTLRATQQFEITITGDSVEAELTVEGGDLSGYEDVSGTVYLFNSAPSFPAPGLGGAIDSFDLNDDDSILIEDLDSDSSGNWYVVIVIEFDEEVTGEGTGVAAELDDIVITLEQV